MPPRDERAFLLDICEASEGIATRVEAIDFDTYLGDETLRLAIERLLGIVGEAVAQLQKSAPEVIATFSDVREIIAFRNILIHGYYVVSHDIVWTIITRRLPTLRAEAVEALRQRTGEEEPPA